MRLLGYSDEKESFTILMGSAFLRIHRKDLINQLKTFQRLKGPKHEIQSILDFHCRSELMLKKKLSKRKKMKLIEPYYQAEVTFNIKWD